MSKNRGELTRAEVAKALGKDKSWVIREEKAGRLKPVRIGKKNARLYDEEYVRKLKGGGGRIERLPKAQAYVPDAATSIMSVSPQVASKAITRLAAGATRLEVLAEFELYPHQVEELDAARMKLCGGLSLTAEQLDEIRDLLGHPAPLDDPDVFLALIRFVADTSNASNATAVKRRTAKSAWCGTPKTRSRRRTSSVNTRRMVESIRVSTKARVALRTRTCPLRGHDHRTSALVTLTALRGLRTTVSRRGETNEAPPSVRADPSWSAANPQPGRTKGARPEPPVAAASPADLGSLNASGGSTSSQHSNQERVNDHTTLNAATAAGPFVATSQGPSINDQASPIPLVHIPDRLDHRFRLDPITRFGQTRSPIPADPIVRFGGPDR